MVAPLLLGILGAGLASQAAVHGWAIPEYEKRRGKRLRGILDELPDDASIDDKRAAMAGAGLLDPAEFARIGFEDQASGRDFFEALRLQQQGDAAAMERLRYGEDAAMQRLLAGRRLDRQETYLGMADELATGGAFGIGQQPQFSGPDRDPYSVGTALDLAWNSITGIESNGKFDALGPIIDDPNSMYYGDRAYGAAQVMGKNVPSWTKRYYGRELTPQEFLQNEEAQRAVFAGKFGEDMQRYGFAEAASRWHSGRGLREAAAAGATDGYMRTLDYVQRATQAFGGDLQRQQATAATFTPELRQQVNATVSAINTGVDLLDYASGSIGRAVDRETVNEFQTAAELALIPRLQTLVNSGALQPGELETFMEWIGNPIGVRLTDSEIGKFRAVLNAIKTDTTNRLAAAGVDPALVFNPRQIPVRVYTQEEVGATEPYTPRSPAPFARPATPGDALPPSGPSSPDEIERYLNR